MVLFEDFSLKEADIRNHIQRGRKSKNGKPFGYYKVKNHKKVFYYNPNIEIDREKAKSKSIEVLKFTIWHSKYITDYPKPTPEFNFYVNQLNVDSILRRLSKIEQFEKKIKLRKKFLKSDIKFLIWEHIRRRNLHKFFVKEFGYLMEDVDSNVSKGGHGRFHKIPKSLRNHLIKRDEQICQHCGKFASDFQLDHIIPIKYGGPSNKWNLQILCKACNQQKLFLLRKKDVIKALNNLGYNNISI